MLFKMIVSTTIVFLLAASLVDGYRLKADYRKLIDSQYQRKRNVPDSGITKSDRVSQRQGSIDFSPELMPGVAGPVNFFDPWLMTRNLDEKSLKLFREAELKHGRVCMLAAVGYLVQESWNPLFDHKIIGASIYHFQQTYNMFPSFWMWLLAMIGTVEVYSIRRGWDSVDTTLARTNGKSYLKDEYIPGDLGFDPLNLVTEENFFEKRTKELNNGRLAMIGIAGMTAQELIDHKTIIDHFRLFGFGLPTLGEASN